MKYRLLKLLQPNVALHRRRFLSTAAVRDNRIPTKKTDKKIPKSQRKAMVDDYVAKYRAINNGKFPGAADTRNQVGGGYYTIRAILQELEYDSTHKDSVVQPAAQRNDTSAIKDTVENVPTFAEAQRVPGPLNMKQQTDGSMLPAVEITNEDSLVVRQRTEAYQISKCTEITDCQVISDRTTMTDNVKVSAEIGSTNQGGVETGHSQMKLHVSSMVESNSMPKEVCGSDTTVSEFDQTSTPAVDTMESIRAGDNLNLAAKNSAVEVVKTSETEKPQFCANSSLPSDIVGEDGTRFGGDKNVTPTTSITNGGYSRGTCTKETQEKEIEETVWGNLKSMANRFINIWR